MLGVWYFPGLLNWVADVDDFLNDPGVEGMEPAEQFRSFCFWLGEDGL